MQIITGKKKMFITILARSGGGKSVLALLLGKAQKKALIVVDTYEQYHDELTMSFEELVEAFNDIKFVESFFKYKKTIILRRGKSSLNSFFDLLMRSSKFENMMILVDEIDMNLGQATVSNKDGFYEFLNRGRHKNFDLITTCRNTQNIPKALIGQTDYFYFSDLIDKGAIAFVDETLHTLDVKEILPTLEPFEFLVVDVNAKDKWKIKTKKEWLNL